MRAEDEDVRWYKLAAEQGYARAQCFLGFSYEIQGHDLDEDKAEAARWYKLAAAHIHLGSHVFARPRCG